MTGNGTASPTDVRGLVRVSGGVGPVSPLDDAKLRPRGHPGGHPRDHRRVVGAVAGPVEVVLAADGRKRQFRLQEGELAADASARAAAEGHVREVVDAFAEVAVPPRRAERRGVVVKPGVAVELIDREPRRRAFGNAVAVDRHVGRRLAGNGVHWGGRVEATR